MTNYQTLINARQVDLVFGPFSTLLTAPAARVANRYGYAFLEPAGGGPAVFAEKLGNVFFVQPAPVVNCGDAFVTWHPLAAGRQRPKTAAYPSLDDPFASPIADRMREPASRRPASRRCSRPIYPPETADFTPIVQKYADAKPDLVVRRHAVRRRLRAGQGDGPAEVQPEVPVPLERRELADRVPEQGRRRQRRTGSSRCGDWFPDSKSPGNPQFVAAYLKKYGGTARRDRPRLGRGLRRRASSIEAVAAKTKQGRQQDDHLVAAQGHVADDRGQPELGRRTARRRAATLSSSGSAASSLPVYPQATRPARADVPKPAWGG